MIIEILIFILCASLIFLSGRNLTKYGEIIGNYLGLGSGWIGLIMMATVTSLPELTVGLSSVTLVGSADLAVGDVLGSCAFNLFILSLLDAFISPRTLFSKASANHVLAAAMSIILLALVGLGIFLPRDIIVTKWIGLTSISFIVVYFFSIRIIHGYEQKHLTATSSSHLSSDKSRFKRALKLYAFNALIVIAAGIALPNLAESIALKSGMGETFTGTLFLAASTSLPEVAVSIAAIRMGSLDMAVGNLMGSNIFNILILAIDDIFYTKGHLLKNASPDNLVSAFSVIIMTAIAIAGLTYRKEKKHFLMAWDSLLIFSLYVLNIILLYVLKNNELAFIKY